MGNLRRLLTFLALFVFFWPIGNPDDPLSPGLYGSENYLFIVAVAWFGILVGLMSRGWEKGDDLMDTIVLSLLLLGVFEVLYSLSLGGKILFMHPIPFLYTVYFLGRLVDPEEFERYLPYVFVLGMFFVFLITFYQVVLLSSYKLRFGTRTAFFAPVGVAFSIYMFNRTDSLREKAMYLLTMVLSVVVMTLFGNRTAYLSLFVLLGLTLIISRIVRNLRSMLVTMGSVAAVGTMSVALLGIMYMGPIFVIYVVQRFFSIFTKLGKGRDPSVMIRKYDIAHALDRWVWQPFFGRSPSDYMLRGIEGSTILFVDNAFVTLLWKYGAVGLLLFLTFLGYSAYLIWNLLKVEKTPFTLLTAFIFVNLLVISISTSVFTTYVHVASLSLLLGVASRKRGHLSTL